MVLLIWHCNIALPTVVIVLGLKYVYQCNVDSIFFRMAVHMFDINIMKTSISVSQ